MDTQVVQRQETSRIVSDLERALQDGSDRQLGLILSQICNTAHSLSAQGVLNIVWPVLRDSESAGSRSKLINLLVPSMEPVALSLLVGLDATARLENLRGEWPKEINRALMHKVSNCNWQIDWSVFSDSSRLPTFVSLSNTYFRDPNFRSGLIRQIVLNESVDLDVREYAARQLLGDWSTGCRYGTFNHEITDATNVIVDENRLETLMASGRFLGLFCAYLGLGLDPSRNNEDFIYRNILVPCFAGGPWECNQEVLPTLAQYTEASPALSKALARYIADFRLQVGECASILGNGSGPVRHALIGDLSTEFMVRLSAAPRGFRFPIRNLSVVREVATALNPKVLETQALGYLTQCISAAKERQAACYGDETFKHAFQTEVLPLLRHAIEIYSRNPVEVIGYEQIFNYGIEIPSGFSAKLLEPCVEGNIPFLQKLAEAGIDILRRDSNSRTNASLERLGWMVDHVGDAVLHKLCRGISDSSHLRKWTVGAKERLARKSVDSWMEFVINHLSKSALRPQQRIGLLAEVTDSKGLPRHIRRAAGNIFYGLCREHRVEPGSVIHPSSDKI